jgi:hypothetical protein
MGEAAASTAAVEVEVFMEVVAGSTVDDLRRSGPVSRVAGNRGGRLARSRFSASADTDAKGASRSAAT